MGFFGSGMGGGGYKNILLGVNIYSIDIYLVLL